LFGDYVRFTARGAPVAGCIQAVLEDSAADPMGARFNVVSRV